MFKLERIKSIDDGIITKNLMKNWLKVNIRFKLYNVVNISILQQTCVYDIRDNI